MARKITCFVCRREALLGESVEIQGPDGASARVCSQCYGKLPQSVRATRVLTPSGHLFPPCLRCGYCCKKATCVVGMAEAEVRGLAPTPCPFLIRATDDQYKCILAITRAKDLAIGAGCTSTLNSDRKALARRLGVI
jgi:hypothetical protein